MISLGKDEETVYVLQKHWLYFIVIPLVIILLGIPIGGRHEEAFGYFFVGWLFLVSPFAVYRLARYQFDEIVVTIQKFHIRIGLINKEVASTPLKNIVNVTFQQGLFGRIFGYGTVHIHSAAGVSSYSYIMNPELAKAAIEQAIAQETTKVTIA